MVNLCRFPGWRTPALAAAAALLAACSNVTADSLFSDPTSPVPDAGATAPAAASDDEGQTAEADAGRDSGKPHPKGPGPGDCTEAPPNVATKTIDQIWSEGATGEPAWITDVAVTGISRGGCAANQACVVYLQSTTTFDAFDDAAHQAIKLSIDEASTGAFAGVRPGDRVRLLATSSHADTDADGEVALVVSAAHAGCVHRDGNADVTPVSVDLDALTHDSYAAHGPVLVKVTSVSGHAGATPRATFGLHPSGSWAFPTFSDVVSLSPFLLPGAKFGPPVALDEMNDFASVTAVFAVFTPAKSKGPAEFLELYPRAANDLER